MERQADASGQATFLTRRCGTIDDATGLIPDASNTRATAMTKPSQALIWMLGFLAAVGALAALLATKLIANFRPIRFSTA